MPKFFGRGGRNQNRKTDRFIEESVRSDDRGFYSKQTFYIYLVVIVASFLLCTIVSTKYVCFLNDNVSTIDWNFSSILLEKEAVTQSMTPVKEEEAEEETGRTNSVVM